MDLVSSESQNLSITLTKDSAVRKAFFRGDYEKCLTLINSGFNVNSQYSEDKFTPLHSASLYGRLDVVRLLLDKGAMKECKTRLGYTPLMCAAQQGHLQVVKLLFERGAKTDTRLLVP